MSTSKCERFVTDLRTSEALRVEAEKATVAAAAAGEVLSDAELDGVAAAGAKHVNFLCRTETCKLRSSFLSS
jgi:hypothetical protein